MSDRPHPPSRPAAQDAYEANIAAPGEILHRDKLVSRSLAWISVAMMLLAFVGAAGGLAEGAPIGAVIGVATVGLLFLFLGLTRSVLRTVVTADDLRIHWGLWGPRIALSAVKSVSVRRDYDRKALTDAMREPGSPRVEMFALPVKGPIIDLQWTDETGRARRAWLGAGDPVALCEAIQRGASTTAPARARFAASADQAGAEEASADEEHSSTHAPTSSRNRA